MSNVPDNIIYERAHAKINIGLDVTGRLPNGYHSVSMVMQTLDIFDELTLSRKDTPGAELEIERVSSHALPEGEILSPGPDNLCVKAAEALLGAVGLEAGVKIRLNKNIPIAAGIGGGSADAAAVLRGINRLLNLELSREKLAEIGAGIGADVPYCVYGGTMHAGGIGEILTTLADFPRVPMVLSRPDIPVSTGNIYTGLDAIEDPAHPDVDGLVAAIGAGDQDGIARAAGNILELVTIPAHPEIASLKELISEQGAFCTCMSGSGPTVFGLFKDQPEAERCVNKIREACPGYYAVVTYPA